jgi:hypothetical protein
VLLAFHAEQEAGDAVAADGEFVDDKCGGEGHGHQDGILGEGGGVPADDNPGKRHDDRFVQQVEREHGLIAITGGALPPWLAYRGGS